MFKEIDDNSNGYAMPCWETERMGEIKELFAKYKGVTADDLWANLKYFLEAIMPTCEECDVKMAIHPDDPPWGIFGLPRIITGKEAVEKLLNMVPSKYNGLGARRGGGGGAGRGAAGGGTGPPAEATMARLICTRLLRLCRRLDLTDISALTTAE